jgi:hypothetical protein
MWHDVPLVKILPQQFNIIREGLNNSMFVISSHSGEGRNPVFSLFSWMPAFTGKTKKTINQRLHRYKTITGGFLQLSRSRGLEGVQQSTLDKYNNIQKCVRKNCQKKAREKNKKPDIECNARLMTWCVSGTPR